MAVPGFAGRAWQLGRAAAKLGRPRNTRLALAMFVLSAIRCGLPVSAVGQGVLLIVACYGVVAVMNDVADIAIDKRNHRALPLAAGLLTSSAARWIGAMYALGLLLVLAVRSAVVPAAFAASYAVLGWAYSLKPLRLSYRGLLGTATLAVCYAVLPFQLAWQQQAHFTQFRGLAISLVVAAAGMAYLLYKDFKDEAGDRAFGKRTPLVRYGSGVVRRLSLGFGAASLTGGLMLAHGAASAVLFAVAAVCLIAQFYRTTVSTALLYGFACSVLLALLPAISGSR